MLSLEPQMRLALELHMSEATKELPQAWVDALRWFDEYVADGAKDNIYLAFAASYLSTTAILPTEDHKFGQLIDLLCGLDGDRTTATLAVFSIKVQAKLGEYPPEIKVKMQELAAAIGRAY